MNRLSWFLVTSVTLAGGAGGAVVSGAAILPERLRIVALNVFHGALEPRPDASGVLRGGAAAVAGAVERAADECPHPACELVLLDGGDEFQGTPASNLA